MKQPPKCLGRCYSPRDARCSHCASKSLCKTAKGLRKQGAVSPDELNGWLEQFNEEFGRPPTISELAAVFKEV